MKKILAASLAILASLSFSAFALEDAIANNEKVEKVEAIETLANPKGTKLFVVGDSTLSSFNDPYYYPRYGYGTKLQDYLLPKKIEVINLAMSGRSSKSFLKEKNYKTLADNIKKGDYLIIGFGHNDEKAEESRYTNPNGSKEEAGSFKNSLYENYIKLALDKKATPILCTPIVRRAPGKAYEGSYVHVTKDVEGFPGGDYAQAIRDLGKETGVLVVDLTAITKDRYEKAGDEGTAKFHAQLSHKPASTDNTHLNTYGASVVAYDVIQAVSAGNKKFAKLVNKKAEAPTEALLVKNPDYVVPKYSEFIPAEDASGLWQATAPWYGTVFGDCGGAEKIMDPEIYEIIEKNGVVEIHAGPRDGSKSVGKIASASDGIAFYFQKLPASKDFTLSAKVKLINFANNNQVSFGLMARDDVYIDKFDNTINSDYVAAGALKIATGDAYTSSWMRTNTQLKETKNAGQPAPAKGQVIDLSITKKGNVYTVKYGKDTATYEANLASVDANNIYVGLFAARCADVEFSNITLK
ncbi:SGNH/GDSL hydrolase family protein [Treponema sp.]|uniref:SGNH/GDSL hydrolase family protein n=1 Tax=Treponema sp. TaxID=166 RepID=UPI00388DB00A